MLEIPLCKFNDGTIVREELRYLNGDWRSKRNYSYEGHIIWGATANIIDNLVKIFYSPFDEDLS